MSAQETVGRTTGMYLSSRLTPKDVLQGISVNQILFLAVLNVAEGNKD